MKLIVKRIVVACAPVVLATAVACSGSAEGNTPPTISPDVFAPIPTPRPFGQNATPTPTPFLLPIPTVVISATETPTATPSATIGAPGPEPTSEATATTVPTPTAAPTSVPTATSIAGSTATPEPTQEPTATSTPEPIVVAPGGIVYSLEAGNIAMDPEQPAPEVLSAGVDVSNFSVAATFDNPLSPTFRDYSYGVKFRENETSYQAIRITSAGDLHYVVGTPGIEGNIDTFEVVQTFDYADVLTAGNEFNTIHLTVVAERAWLFINEDYVGEFTVSDAGTSADVQLIAELENETDVSGAKTELLGVVVRSTGTAVLDASGTLVKEAGEISRTDPTGIMRDSIVEATFVSPYERILGKWSVGIEYVEPATGTANLLIINNSRFWKHLRIDGTTGETVEVASGTANQILRDRGDLNGIMMLGRNGVYEVFINGVFVTTVTFDAETDLPASVSAVAGVESGDQVEGIPTHYQDFTVWSFGS